MALSVATAITLQEVVSMQYPPGERHCMRPDLFVKVCHTHVKLGVVGSMVAFSNCAAKLPGSEGTHTVLNRVLLCK